MTRRTQERRVGGKVIMRDMNIAIDIGKTRSETESGGIKVIGIETQSEIKGGGMMMTEERGRKNGDSHQVFTRLLWFISTACLSLGVLYWICSYT